MSAPAGSLQEVVRELAKHMCLHVLSPLLKLHPRPVRFDTAIQQDADEGSYSVEISFNAVDQPGDLECCSVESAALQCLQAIKRKYTMLRHAYSMSPQWLCQWPMWQERERLH